MKYIEAILDIGNNIINISFEGDNVIVEDSEGEEHILSLNDKVTCRVFESLEPRSLLDIIKYYKNKKIFFNTDSEKDAIFNSFPDMNFKEYLDSEDIDLEDLSSIFSAAFGLLKGKEKELSFKEIKNIIETELNYEISEF